MTSHQSGDPSDYNDHEWLIATYTTDGTNIHAIIHNEFQGHSHTDQVTCNSGSYSLCWFNSLGYATSNDTGRTYTHAPAPGHLLAAAPYEYQGDVGPFGLFGGSNIAYNSNDGYYYCIIQMETHEQQRSGVSVIRTRDLSDPTSWRGWNGNSFNAAFINPYTETGFDPNDHILMPIGNGNIEKMNSSLTWNTYFNKWLLVGMAQKGGVWGFYYSLSEDLINWTVRKLILQGNVIINGQPGSDILAYPSVVDHADTSRNFEVTGQEVYLYYTLWHAGTTYDRDLVRVQIRFNKLLVDKFEITGKGDLEDTNVGDGICTTSAGNCSFRAAIQESNARPPWYADSTIAFTFNISGTGPFTIDINNGAWQSMWYPVHIDGYTQTGAVKNSNSFSDGIDAQPMIDIDANGEPGLSFEADSNTIKGLIIRNTLGGAIELLNSDHNVIQGNFLNTDATGMTAGNSGNSGLKLLGSSDNRIGGITNEDRNLIIGGILIAGPDAANNAVEGNHIGTDKTGTLKLDTWATGISISDAAQNNTIGGSNALARNLISGNNSHGVVIWGGSTSGNLVLNNFIGTDVTGTQKIGNGLSCVQIANGPEGNYIGQPGMGNVIAYGSDSGIWIDAASRNFIQANFIGTDTSATLDLGNKGPGMYLIGETEETHIGGAGAGEANVIAYNDDGGIVMQSNVNSGIKFWNNEIYANDNRIGIDLGYDGWTPNDDGDSDDGPNNRQNYPELSSAHTGDFLTINGSLNSTANATFRIEFFVNDDCDLSGYGEGQTYLDAVAVTTNAEGDVEFSFDLQFDIATGKYITSTASAPDNSTSEFSNCVQVLASSGLLTASPSEISGSADLGDSTTATLEIGNVGNLVTDWSLTWDGNWIEAYTTSGNLDPSETTEVLVTLNGAELAEGTHHDTLTVTSSEEAQLPLLIPVALTVSAQPDISVSPGSLSASIPEQGSISNALTIRNDGSADLNFNIGTVYTAQWLSANVHNGTLAPGSSQDVTVTADASALDAGSYEGVVIVTSNDPDENPVNVSFSLTVTGDGARISVAPQNLQRQVPEHDSSNTLLVISNVGTLDLTWDLSGTPQWFVPTPTSGTTMPGNQDSVTAVFDAGDLSIGTYTDTLKVYSNDQTTPEVKVAITLEVSPSAPAITVSPAVIQRTVSPDGESQTWLEISNSGNADLTWHIPGTPNWLLVAATDGTTQAGEVDSVKLTLDASGLNEGSYVHALQFLSNDVTVEVSVTLDVSSQQYPAIGVAHNSLVATLSTGDSTEHVLGIWNEGQVTLDWLIDWRAAWIAVESPLGNIAPGHGTDVKVRFISSGLANGTYTDTLFVDSNDPNNARFRVTASMTVESGEQVGPDFDMQPASIDLIVTETEVQVIPVVFYNKGDSDLTWQASFARNTAWMKVIPASASIAPGDSTAATIELVLTGLENNTYIDNLLITCNDPDETSRELPISVTLDVVISGFSATGTVPQTYTMAQNYPNPFNPTTTISFSLPGNHHVTLAVFDVTGRRVESLLEGPRGPGRYQVQFDATGLPSGAYYYELRAGSVTERRAMVLAR
jgi:uncharacterized membrane protein